MAEPAIPSEFPYRGRKRQAEEEEGNMNKEEEDDSEDSDYSIGYDSDDPIFEILEGKANRKVWEQYFREWDESEGFDISVFPGTSFTAGIAQQYDHLTSPKIKEEYTMMCELAIKKFNKENDKMYAFKEIVNVNASFAAGTWYYFTFKASDATGADADADADDTIKTFQALVWHGIDNIIDVSFCRLKKFLTNEDKKKLRKERKKKLQQKREAVTKVEQDMPYLVKSFVPGLVIEELSKGKPGGRKAFPGFKGFDISVFPGTSFMAGIAQQYDHLTSPKIKEEYTMMCELAIKKFNKENDKMYAFKEIVNVNASFAAGTWYYFTFKASDATGADADDAIKTFQALVWHGIDNIIDVSFCRLKKFLTNEDKKKLRKERKKKLQQKREAVTKVEQDMPYLVKSFVPGLVIEELSKGKPGGRKAFPGFKVGIRYTCKLKENDKVFDTNIGIGDPLEFRIASAQLIKGWEMGVNGMRVGDKRRITIPPALGYGDKGYLDVVPPDSWLVIEVELIYIS